MNTKIIQYLLLLPGIVGVILIGSLLNRAAPGSGIVFWIALFVIFLLNIRRYPKEEVFALLGIVFGFIILIGLGGAYYFISRGHEVFAAIWLVIWLIGIIIFQKRIRRWLTPTFFLADEFAAMVGPIHGYRQLPKGCIIVILESILFFILLMVAGLLGPILWIFHIILFTIFEKRNQEKSFEVVKLIMFIVMNIFLMMVLYFILDSIGVEPVLRKIMGG